MEKIKSYITKKNLDYVLVILGVIACISIFQIRNLFDLDDIHNVANKIGLLSLVFMIILIGSLVVIAGACYIKFYRKTNEKDIMFYLVLEIISLLGAFNGSQIVSAIVSSANSSGSLDQFVSNLMMKIILIILSILIQIILGVKAIINLKKNEYIENAIQATDNNNNNLDIKNVVSGKTGKLILVILAIVIVAGVVYQLFFNKPKSIDIILGDSCEVTYEGDSGEGSASFYCRESYDSNELEDTNDSVAMSDFLSTVEYTITNNGELSNGDELVIKIVYDESKADENNYNVTIKENKYEVTGLIERYKSSDDIPTKTMKKIDQLTVDEMNDIIEHDRKDFMSLTKTNDRDFSFEDIEDNVVKSKEFVSKYTTYDKEYKQLDLHYIYKVKTSGKVGDNQEERIVYLYFRINDINSEEEYDQLIDWKLTSKFIVLNDNVSGKDVIKELMKETYDLDDLDINDFEEISGEKGKLLIELD